MKTAFPTWNNREEDSMVVNDTKLYIFFSGHTKLTFVASMTGPACRTVPQTVAGDVVALGVGRTVTPLAARVPVPVLWTLVVAAFAMVTRLTPARASLQEGQTVWCNNEWMNEWMNGYECHKTNELNQRCSITSSIGSDCFCYTSRWMHWLEQEMNSKGDMNEGSIKWPTAPLVHALPHSNISHHIEDKNKQLNQQCQI